MKALSLILRFFARYLPSFSRIGYWVRSLGWSPLRLDASGQTWLVTGASGGLGEAIASAGAAAGADILAVARSRDKLEAMHARQTEARGDVTLIEADCASLDDLRRLASDLAGTKIDVLVNNVGVLLNEYSETSEGFETSYATNILGQFALTEALIENGTLGRDSLVVSMSSGGMYNVPTLPDELDAPAENFNGARAYALHKRAQVTLTDLWKQRHAERGIAFLVAHPGWVDTQGVKTSLPVFRRLLAPVLRGVKEGVDTVLWLIGRRPVTGVERIWFDRAARPVHMGSATREASAPAAQLWDRLASDAGR